MSKRQGTKFRIGDRVRGIYDYPEVNGACILGPMAGTVIRVCERGVVVKWASGSIAQHRPTTLAREV